MENQHRLIDGYRELSETEIAFMNEIKMRGAEIHKLVELLRKTPPSKLVIDERWLNIGVTDLQKGFMALTRAVTKPNHF